MRLDQLEYMLEISKSKSITIAAENLYISQPALSRAIKSLEQELGMTLLFRTASGVSLTKMGELLLPQMQEIITQSQKLFSQVRNLRDICLENNTSTTLTILTIPTIADALLPPALEQFSSLFPQVDLNIQMLDFENPVESSFGNSFALTNIVFADLTVVMNVSNTLDQTILDSGLQIEPLFVENLSIVVSLTHKLAQKNVVSLHEVLQYKLIVHDNGFCAEEFYSELTDCPQKLNIILKSNNPRAISQLLVKQHAVLLSNNLLAKNDYMKNEDLKIIPIKNLKSHYIGLFAPDHPNLCLIKELIDTLKFVRSKM